MFRDAFTQPSARRSIAKVGVALLLLLAAAPGFAIDKASVKFVGLVDIRIDLEQVRPSIGGLCHYDGSATLRGRGPANERIQTRPEVLAMLAPCGLELERTRARGVLAILGLARSPQRIAVEDAAGLITIEAGGIPVDAFATFGHETSLLFEPGPEAEIVFDAESADGESVPYPPGVDGFVAFGHETSLLYSPGPVGFATFGHETGL